MESTTGDRTTRCMGSGLLRIGLAALAMVIPQFLSGCASFSRDSESGMLDMSSLLSTRHIRGPWERRLSDSDSVLALAERYSPEAQREVEAAVDQYEAGQYSQARSQLKKAAHKYKDSAIGEQAQFYLGETYYATGQFPKAQDAYDQLFEDYPSTRYVEPASRRLFEIAKNWLDVTDPVPQETVRTVSAESGETEVTETTRGSYDPTIRARILPNFHDRTRPVFDTQGRAMQALKSIWMNDPTGPLADDALMMTATWYQRHRNYVEADRYYQILREEYPDSPHLEDAFLLGSHVRLMSYQGPHYDGASLEGARRLKEQSLHLFPASHERTQIRRDLDRLYLQEAERAWSMVEYEQKKRRPRAIAIACMNVILEFPDTQFADEARRVIRSIDRRVLADLPDINEFLDSLPDTPPPAPASGGGSPVKSVSDSRADDPDSGRVRL